MEQEFSSFYIESQIEAFLSHYGFIRLTKEEVERVKLSNTTLVKTVTNHDCHDEQGLEILKVFLLG